MANYTTPGVYVEEISVFPPSVAQVETAIPAFIGYTEKAPTTTFPSIRRIISLKEYEQYFGFAKAEAISATINIGTDGSKSVALGTITPTFFMYYQMQMYFANGGGPCYIVSAGAGYSTNQKIDLSPALEAVRGLDEPTMLVLCDSPSDTVRVELAVDALTQAGELMDRFAILDVPNGAALDLSADATTFRGATGTSYLSYGAAYYPKILTSLVPRYTDQSVTLTFSDTSNIFHGKTLAEVLSGYDPDPDPIVEGDESLYRELKGQIDTALQFQPLTLFPGGAVSGVYAKVDSTRGVWKAPANVSLNLVRGAALNITDKAQGGLNIDPTTGKSINAIRSFYGKGTLVWGARTLAGNDNEWRYVSVRRFYNMVEESVKKASAAFVFEPNSANTWVKVRAMIENFLTLQWRAGALAGAKPEDAFFVRVGLGQTMSAQDILEGRMIVEIGMAAVRPAEFIILRFSHMMQQS
jgi:phage tail sheath protein FI